MGFSVENIKRWRDLHLLKAKSWHWIKAKGDANILIERLNTLDFSVSENTARQNSLGKGELVSIFSLHFSI